MPQALKPTASFEGGRAAISGEEAGRQARHAPFAAGGSRRRQLPEAFNEVAIAGMPKQGKGADHGAAVQVVRAVPVRVATVQGLEIDPQGIAVLPHL